jgi:hypothetical protein
MHTPPPSLLKDPYTHRLVLAINSLQMFREDAEVPICVQLHVTHQINLQTVMRMYFQSNMHPVNSYVYKNSLCHCVLTAIKPLQANVFLSHVIAQTVMLPACPYSIPGQAIWDLR